MADRTKIEWAEATWNPATGCTKVSPGCDHCYAERIAHRFAGTKAYPDGFTPTLRPERLDQPLRWRRPRRIFVCSMADLFHVDVPADYVARVWAVMAMSPRHTFQVLTKRAGRMRSLLNQPWFRSTVEELVAEALEAAGGGTLTFGWPLRNVWLGVSAETQHWADVRIPALLATPAAVRWVSAEPLLGPIDLGPAALRPYERQQGGYWDYATATDVYGNGKSWVPAPPAQLDWVVVGGESGRGARPMHPDWARSLRDQCAAAGIAYLFKQWGAWTPLAPLRDGVYDFTGSYSLANDGTLYEPGTLAYPDGSRWGEAMLARHGRAHLTHMYRVGKKAAGRELDGRAHDGYPA